MKYLELFEIYTNKEQESKEFFLEKLDNCYQVTRENKFPEWVYWVYDPEKVKDKAFTRSSKFGLVNSVLNDEEFNEIKEQVIFWQDLKNKYFYVDYDKIWSVFKSKLGLNYQEIKDLTTGWLNEHTKLKEYICLEKGWL